MAYLNDYTPATWRIEYLPPGGQWTLLARETAPHFGSPTITRSYETPQGAVGNWEMRAVLESGGSIDSVTGRALQVKSYDTISGKTTSRYKRSYYVPLAAPGPWDIRVLRNTPDSTSSALKNETWWDSVASIVESKLNYPNSAVVGVSVDAEQFSNIPSRGYEIYGILCKIPSNYDPIARTYNGLWNGQFVTAWTNNPAWVYYDLLTNARYGLGSYISATGLDKWALYDIAKYCDQLVPSGFGYSEPRFTCNLYLQTREDAYKILNSMTSVFRGMSFWSAGQVTTVCDMPSDAISLFTNANVIEGEFSYAGSAKAARHTVALVTWNDPDDMYTQKVEYVEDVEGIISYGVNQTEVVAFGCTSRGQAHRFGKWILYTERLESEVVSFKTGLEGTSIYPGAIIKIADTLRSGDRVGGRILESTLSTVTLDSPIDILDGYAYTLTVVMPDGATITHEDGTTSKSKGGQLVSRVVTNAAGNQSVMSLSADLPFIPQKHAMWVMSSVNADPALGVVPQMFRVLSVAESGKAEITVTALEHNPNKFAMVEYDQKFEPASISSIPSTAPKTPTSLVATDTLYLQGPGLVGTKLHMGWSGRATRYEVKWKQGSDNFKTTESKTNSVDIAPVVEGPITLLVRGVDTLGRKSSYAELTYDVVGKRAPPSDVPYLIINGNVLTWGAVSDLDLDGYELRWQTGNSRSWGDAQPMHEGLLHENSHAMVIRPSGTCSLMIKAVDTSGNVSKRPMRVVTNLGDPLVENVLVTRDFHEIGFPGVKTGSVIDGDTGDLLANIDSIPLMWSSNASDLWSIDEETPEWVDYTYSAMTYTDTFATVAEDAGAQLTLQSSFDAGVFSVNYRKESVAPMWSDAPDLVWTNDTVPMWKTEAWIPWPGSLIAEPTTYEWMVSAASGQMHIRPRISKLLAQLDVPDIVERFNDISVSASGTRLPITKTYRKINNIALTLQSDGGNARSVMFVDKSTSLGPLVSCKDDSGVGTTGSIDATIQGY